MDLFVVMCGHIFFVEESSKDSSEVEVPVFPIVINLVWINIFR